MNSWHKFSSLRGKSRHYEEFVIARNEAIYFKYNTYKKSIPFYPIFNALINKAHHFEACKFSSLRGMYVFVIARNEAIYSRINKPYN